MSRSSSASESASPAVCVADGYGITVNVRRGRLVVRDGIGRQRRERIYPRVRPGISRLVVVGRAGTVTLEAIRWLTDLNIHYIHIDRDGTQLATTTPTSADARLRRVQARAPLLPIGLDLAREILHRKIQGQQQTLQIAALGNCAEALATIDQHLRVIEETRTLAEILSSEREAALAYWSSWSRLDVRFAPADRDRIPDHWHTFEQRHSPLTSSPRVATNPANALLNYLYAVLEAETRIATLVVGLDPTLGLFHADYRSRDSFVLDLMETARPLVDRYVLELIDARTFTRRDFIETTRGQCKLRAQLTQELAQTAPMWADAIAPQAEHIASRLANESDASIGKLATPLTSTNRRVSRAAPQRQAVTKSRRAVPPQRTCKRCGGPLPHQKRVYCDTCLPEFRREQRESSCVSTTTSQNRTRSVARTHGGLVAEKRGMTNIERKRAIREWELQYGKLVDSSTFEREILHEIQRVSLSRLCRASGLSIRYVSQIRRGEKTPHPRHWEAFRAASLDQTE
jgi:CRISPR-associated endonuclease Cas1